MSAPIQNCNVQFAYECPKDWSRLMPTDREDVRFCQNCSKDVFFCKTSDEASSHARAGHCVALQLEEAVETKPSSIHESLRRVRKPRMGLIYDVDGATPSDDGVRRALQDIGRVVDKELKDVRNEQEGKNVADVNDGIDKAT